MADLVYIVRNGDSNEELRYSIRSATANLPHGNVWLVGNRPRWLSAPHIPTEQVRGDSWHNSRLNVRTACEASDISDPFVLMNDDFFLTRPVASVPPLHWGTVRRVYDSCTTRARESNPYVKMLAETINQLAGWGFPDPLCYELHVPLLVHKAPMLDAIARDSVMKRTVYGNLAGLGGEFSEDVKVRGMGRDALDRVLDTGSPFLSTVDGQFNRGAVGDYLKRMFPDPSPYEAA